MSARIGRFASILMIGLVLAMSVAQPAGAGPGRDHVEYIVENSVCGENMGVPPGPEYSSRPKLYSSIIKRASVQLHLYDPMLHVACFKS